MRTAKTLICGFVLVGAFGGCAVMDSVFGPSKASLERADKNKDGKVDETERKEAGLPADASPWIDLVLQLGRYLLPGVGVAVIAYRKVKENREQIESLVTGVEGFIQKKPDAKMELYKELEAAGKELGDPDKLFAIVRAIKDEIRKPS